MSNPPLIPGAWPLDPVPSGVRFEVRPLGLTDVRGWADVQLAPPAS